MKPFFKTLPSTLLILLFIYAAGSKLLRFSVFRGQLYNQSFPHGLADILVYALPALELLAVCLLLFHRTQLAGLQLSLYLMLLFTGYIALVLLQFWDRVPCSCGGILSRMSWGSHLVFNLVFTATALAAIRIHITDQKGAAENLRKE